MKYRILSISLAAALFAACSVNSEVIDNPDNNEVEEFFATIENESTRVFADDQLRVLWNADDRVSIFNKNTFNYEYKFTGEDGDNSGSFKKVPNEEFVTGNQLDYAYSVYPYQESTKISNDGVITVTLPAKQIYKANSFGKAANTMIAITQDDELMFKNLCGYLTVKLFGDNVSISSITIKGNNNEPLAGKATVNASIDGVPSLSFDSSATKEIKLSFETSVTLGTSAETATTFWFVVPPTTFSKGFTISCAGMTGVFEKSTTKSFEIGRNTLSKMAELKVIPEISNGAIVFADSVVKKACVEKYDSDGDGEISYREAAVVKSIAGLFDNYRYIESFDEFRYFTGVTYIPARCFARMAILSSITLPESIIGIGDYAFTECSHLQSFHLPNTVTTIGLRAFAKCYELKSFTFESGSKLKSLDGYTNRDIDGSSTDYSGVFGHCTSLSSIIIPASVNNIGYRAFYDCTALKTVTFEQGSRITSIPGFDWNGVGGPFYGCTALESVVLPETVTSIGYGAFYNCWSLKDINLSQSLESIAISAFSGCRELNGAFSFPSLKSIGQGAFSGCRSIKSVALSDNCTTIGASAFAYCENLSSIQLSRAQTYIENNTFYGCKSLRSITLPKFLSSIGANAFSGCTALTTITWPQALTSIGSRAFAGCRFEDAGFTLELPASVTSIESGAFGYIRHLIVPSTSPVNIASNSFASGYTFIYVPADMVETYKARTNWSIFADYIRPISDYPAENISPVGGTVGEAVDLGLSVKWASWNVGASAPEEYGTYFAWGETRPAWGNYYSWETYKWSSGTSDILTKYNTSSTCGMVDNKTTIDSEDDAAHANWGGAWRMPTSTEVQELIDNCNVIWTTENGVKGRRFISKKDGYTDRFIFIPAAGERQGSKLSGNGNYGMYWLSSLYTYSPADAYGLYFSTSGASKVQTYDRFRGFSVRPVCP